MNARHGFVFIFLFFVASFAAQPRAAAGALVSLHDTLKRFDAMTLALETSIQRGRLDANPPVDTVVKKSDSVRVHSPRRAAIYSALVPGLGQVYNREYWKVPVIYAGGTVAGYLIYYNYSVYKNLRKALRYRNDTLPDTNQEQFSIWTIDGGLDVNLENFGNAEVIQLQQTYRRDLDLSVLLAAGIYALNIVDAVVFAHLYDFDVSEDLTLRVKPDFQFAHRGLVNNGSANVKPMMQVGLTYRF